MVQRPHLALESWEEHEELDTQEQLELLPLPDVLREQYETLTTRLNQQVLELDPLIAAAGLAQSLAGPGGEPPTRRGFEAPRSSKELFPESTYKPYPETGGASRAVRRTLPLGLPTDSLVPRFVGEVRNVLDPFQNLLFKLPWTSTPWSSDASTDEIAATALALNQHQIKIADTHWRLNVLSTLPTIVANDPEISVEEVLEKVTLSAIDADDERYRFVQAALSQLAVEESSTDIIDVLRQPGGTLSQLLSLNFASMTAKDSVDALISASAFQLPEGMTPAEMRAYVLASGGSQEDADNLFDVEYQVDQISQQFAEDEARRAILIAEGQRIVDGEIHSSISKALWVNAMMQPAIMALRPVEWWNNQAARPIAGHAMDIVFSLPDNLVGSPDPSVERKFRNDLARAQAEGADSWTAHRIAFEGWDTNWFIRFSAEVLADPLTPIGFGLYPKLFKVVPYVGKYAGTFERGYVRIMDAPFRKARQVWVDKAPRTLGQRGAQHSSESIKLQQIVFAQVYNGKNIRNAQPGQTSALAAKAVDAVLSPETVTGMDHLTAYGRSLLGFKHLSGGELETLLRDLGEKVTTETLDPLIMAVNRVMTESEGFGISKFSTINEAAGQILILIGNRIDDEGVEITKRWLKTQQKSLRSAALAPFEADTVKAQALASSRYIQKSFVAAQKGYIASKRYQEGILASAVHGLQTTTRLNWISVVDQAVTQRFARAYLVFGFYGVMNVAEAAIKTILSGNSPFYRGNVFQRAAFFYHNIGGYVPREVLTDYGFNLGTGRPEEIIRNFRTAASKQEKSRATRILDKHLDAVADSRSFRVFGDSILGDIVHSPAAGAVSAVRAIRQGHPYDATKILTGYNWGKRIAGAQLANYHTKMYKRLLTETRPDTVRAASQLVDEVTKNLDTVMSKQMANGYREAITEAVLTGDAAFIRNLPSEFTPGRVRRGEVEVALQDYAELPPDVLETAANLTETGTLWSVGGLEAFRADALERIYQEYFQSPKTFEKHFKDMLEAILEETPTDFQGLLTKISTVQLAIDIFHSNTSNTLRAAVHYTRSFRAADDRLNALWKDKLESHIVNSSLDLERAVAQLRKDLDLDVFAENLTPELRDQYNVLLDSYITRNTAWKDSRVAYDAVRSSFFDEGGVYFRPVGKGRDSDWWNSFHYAAKKTWDDGRDEALNAGILTTKTLINITGEIVTIPRDVSARQLSRRDIASLYGVSAMDLEGSMFLPEILAIQDRKEFIAQTIARVELGARAPGGTAADLGWTEESIGAVYDSMIRKYRADPIVTEGIEPMKIQLEAVMSDLEHIGMRRNAIISDDSVAVLEKDLEEIINSIFPTPAGGGIGVEPAGLKITTEFTPSRQLALPSGEATILRQAEELKYAGETARDLAERQFNAVSKFSTDLKASTGRRAAQAGQRLTKLSEDFAIDTRYAEQNLEVYKNLQLRKSMGEDIPVADLKEAWDRFIFQVDSMQVDIEGTVQAALREVRQGFAPGTPGAPEPTQAVREVAEEAVPVVAAPRKRTVEELLEAGDYELPLTANEQRRGIQARTVEQIESSIKNQDAEASLLRRVETQTKRHFDDTDELSDREVEFVEDLLPANKSFEDATFEDVKEAVRKEMAEIDTRRTRLESELVEKKKLDLEAREAAMERGIERIGLEEAAEAPQEDVLSLASKIATARAQLASSQKVNSAQAGRLLDELQDRGIDVAEARQLVVSYRDLSRDAFEGVNAASAFNQARSDSWDEVTNALELLNAEALPGAEEAARVARAAGRPEETLSLEAQERIRQSQYDVKDSGHPSSPDVTYTRTREQKFVQYPGQRDSRLAYLASPEWQVDRNAMLAETNTRMALDFPDYSNPTAVTAFMKTIYPFWGYEAHRWAWWLPREALRHPGIFAAWGKYTDNTELGYINFPGPLDINPLRGTIFMGGFRRLAMRDYPEYYDQFPNVAKVFDYGSRFGFYPGVIPSGFLAAFGAKIGKPQLGELLPASGKTALASIVIISPTLGKELQEMFFTERYRDYIIGLQASAIALEEGSGLSGPEIIGKRIREAELTPEEEALWLRATRAVAPYQILMEQTGLFRFNPDERRRARTLAAQIQADALGIKLGDVEDLRRFGISIEDHFGPFHPEIQDAFQLLDVIQKFSGASIGLQPSQMGLSQARVREFWQVAEAGDEAFKGAMLDDELEFVSNPNTGTMNNWFASRKDRMVNRRAGIEQLKEADEFEDVPVTLVERKKKAEETGVAIVLHQLEELQALYFQYELQEVWDWELEMTVPDWESFYQHREAIENALPDDQRAAFIEHINRKDTPLEALHHQVNKLYLRPYDEAADALLKKFSPEHQTIIRQSRVAVDKRRTELRDETYEDSGKKVVADYEAQLRQIRDNMRQVDPELDAWLVFFGKARTTKTDAASRILQGYFDTIKKLGGAETLVVSQ